MKIAIIGSGNLGLSIAKGLVYNNTYTSLYLTKRDLSAIKEWEEYIKFTDKYINCYSVNEYTISNFFLHPTRPIIQTNRILSLIHI